MSAPPQHAHRRGRLRSVRVRGQARGHAEAGAALPVVLGVMLTLTAFMLSALALVLNNMAPSRSDQDSRAALAAAQAGVDEYISRLSVDSEYWDRGNADPGNTAFDPAGRVVPGTGTEGARFRYRVLTDSATTAQQGYIVLEVTGTSQPPGSGRAVSRTLTVRLEPTGFLDYVYFTNFETIDPSLRDVNEQVRDLCTRHYYTPYSSGGYYAATRPDSYCPIINWTSGDVVDGPLHSNDALYVGGAVRFTDRKTESSWVKTVEPNKLWRGPGTPSTGTSSAPGYWPRYAGTLDLPDANTELLKYVQPVTDSSPNPDTATARPGCLYVGATRITFDNNQMKVFSPNTTNAPERCLTTASRALEQTKPVPEVIYVAPATGPCEGVGYPRLEEDVTDRTTTDYNPCRGSAFVSGTVDGRTTVSAEDDIVVTADLNVADDGAATDVIGLIAGNYVWVYHPVRDNGTNLLDSADAVRTIEAALVSLRHSFVVQNWSVGAPLSTNSNQASKLRVFGSISQQFRGPVGTGTAAAPSTGYLKNYIYDDRLQVLQPPYFILPENAPWEVVQTTDG